MIFTKHSPKLAATELRNTPRRYDQAGRSIEDGGETRPTKRGLSMARPPPRHPGRPHVDHRHEPGLGQAQSIHSPSPKSEQ